MNGLETNIYHARKTILEMMEDRGYDTSNHIKDIPKELFLETIADDNLEMLFEKDDEKLVVYFYTDEKISKKQFISISNKLISDYDDDKINIILVLPNKASSAIKREIQENPTYSNIQLYQLKHLIINITKHVLQPKFDVLNDEEVEEICSRLSILKKQFPKILITDPISKYYGVKKNQVFKITRKSNTAGEYTTYRIVV